MQALLDIYNMAIDLKMDDLINRISSDVTKYYSHFLFRQITDHAAFQAIFSSEAALSRSNFQDKDQG